MISKFLAALAIAAAGLFADLFASVAAPASAACAPGFTSIPCTIATNVAAAPATTAGSLAAAPSQVAGAVVNLPNQFAQGAQTLQNLVGENYPDGSALDTCGLTGAPGQSFGAGGGLEQIVTAPQTIAGALAAAPGQFASAIQNGGTAPTTP
ncbi:MAG: hypothetical protein M3O32_06595 [Actinomycetota bacterium]|nr:hypothetical protein [Actinomycetota bacterium]